MQQIKIILARIPDLSNMKLTYKRVMKQNMRNMVATKTPKYQTHIILFWDKLFHSVPAPRN
jgi:hypothetical protein